ncbi:hypothetical protein D4764_09G0004610 [Takifugu flavidus]|uniref:Uncharacterized protein n=1 Tax=Takifugu flavidus TaxID=433684 RepID=A0A5C6MJW0_9TELE|nr:hypothetical protein D4764_09G0004610 [Takifugu flavidus]
MVHRSEADPNSLLRPTTRFHISRNVNHLAKLLNTSSSLNTSREKLLETQRLWYSLTEGSKTTSVPVVTMETAVVTPPTAALPTPLMQDSIEKIVQRILEMEQQQHRPEEKMRREKTCLACGQPKSRNLKLGRRSPLAFLKSTVSSSVLLVLRFHISRNVNHLAKLLNTSSSLNTSREKLLETQRLWYSLTEGSKTTSVPVVTMETAVVTPPTAALPTPLMQDSIEKHCTENSRDGAECC